jgi:hypothetical protein
VCPLHTETNNLDADLFKSHAFAVLLTLNGNKVMRQKVLSFWESSAFMQCPTKANLELENLQNLCFHGFLMIMLPYC